MFFSARVFQAYARSIRRALGAESCSLFVPAVAGGLESPILIHEGEIGPVPELATLDSALELHRSACGAARGPTVDQAGLRLLRSAASDGYLLALPTPGLLMGAEGRSLMAPIPERRTVDNRTHGSDAAPPGWLGLRGAEVARAFDDLSAVWAPALLLGVGAVLSWHAQRLFPVLEDSVTGLPERTVLHAVIDQALHRARAEQTPVSLLLISPVNLSTVNERLGRAIGDQLLRELASRLGSFFRRSDLVSRYGAGTFAVVLADSGREQAQVVARRLLAEISAVPFSQDLGEEQPRFAIGLIGFDPAADEIEHPQELLRRADLALGAARQSEQPGCVIWSPDLAGKVEASDRLSGIFTAQLSRDYRNMVLLWDTINAVAAHSELGELAFEVTLRLFETIRPDELGLFLLSDDNEMVPFRALVSNPRPGGAPIETDELALSEEQRRLLDDACLGRRPVDATAKLRGPGDWCSHAFPLVTEGESIGCLYLAGNVESLKLDALNVSFLDALAGQLARAIHSARNRDRANNELHTELKVLREVIGDTKVIHSSEVMRRVLRQVQRVAPSDVNVLVLGESGTGKELLARTIHEASERSRGPFVVLDCGAVAPSLLETELFGHERGAFTGAHARKTGRLAEAAGGTVLLDEIGELPVDLQAKLLRFVQERQLVPVGATSPRHVDARIIAATHRDLRVEVEAGRFRADLYYRLNVIRIDVPPLRERPEDVVLLARHFVRVYSLRYDRSLFGLTRSAERALVRHRWPGNVRELQNRIMKAVLLCDRDRIGPEDLELAQDAADLEPVADQDAPTWLERRSERTPVEPTADVMDPREVPLADGVWVSLRDAVRKETERALAAGSTSSAPVATWLDEDLVREALAASGGILSTAASLLGVPESTLRRKSLKASQRSFRPSSWRLVERAARLVVGAPRRRTENVLLRVRRLVLELLLDWSPPLSVATRASLMGVTPQTLRRWSESLAAGTGEVKSGAVLEEAAPVSSSSE